VNKGGIELAIYKTFFSKLSDSVLLPGKLSYKSRRGGISVFLCLILVALLVLAGTLTDAARIAVAERQVQNAVDSALRSVMADYDSRLSGDYGIYALNTGNISGQIETFYNYFSANLSQAGSKTPFIKYYFDRMERDKDISLETYGCLTENDIYKKQIMDFMKYRGALYIGENIYDKFKEAKLLEKLKFSRKEKIVRKKREELIGNIESINQKVDAVMQNSEDASLDNLYNMKSTLEEASVSSSKLKESFDRYNEAKQDSELFAKEVNSEAKSEGEKIMVTESNEFSGVIDESEILHEKIEKNLKLIDETIVKIEPLQNELDLVNNSINELDDRIQELDRNISLIEDKISELKNKMKDDKSSEKNPEGNSEKDIEDESINMEIISLENELNYLDNEKLDLQQDMDSLTNRANEIKNTMDDIKSSFKLERMEKIKFNKAENTEKDEKLDWSVKNAVSSLISSLTGEYSKFLNNIDPNWLTYYKQDNGSGNNGSTGDDDTFSTIENVDEKNMEEDLKKMNRLPESYEAEMENDKNMDLLDNILGLLEKSVEKAYIVEYIMNNYSYLTMETKKGSYLQKGEIEYILWGDTSQISNILKNVGSIWALRLAINTMDYFAVSVNPEPVSRLVYAVGKAFVRSCMDISQLYSGKSINICPSLSTIKLDYADHLRVFLLIGCVTDENGILDRSRQLIQVNRKQSDNSFNMANFDTMFDVSVKVDINLWFLHIFNLDRIRADKFKSKYYTITKSSCLSFLY